MACSKSPAEESSIRAIAMEQLENLVLVVSDAILRHGVDCTEPEGKQEITTSLLSLLKFTKIPNNETQIFADQLADMTEFLTLLHQLIGGQLVGKRNIRFNDQHQGTKLMYILSTVTEPDSIVQQVPERSRQIKELGCMV